MARQRRTTTTGLRPALVPLLAFLLLSPPALGRTRRSSYPSSTSASATSDTGPWGGGRGQDTAAFAPERRLEAALGGGVPTVYQELLASADLISQRLYENGSSLPLSEGAPLTALAAAAATTASATRATNSVAAAATTTAAAGGGGGKAAPGMRAAARGGKMLVPASGVISLCLSQGKGPWQSRGLPSTQYCAVLYGAILYCTLPYRTALLCTAFVHRICALFSSALC